MEVLKNVKSEDSIFRIAKADFDTGTHPFQWANDQIISAVKSALITTLTRCAGGPAARAMVERLDLEGKTYPLILNIPVHANTRNGVSNPEYGQCVQEVLNDVLTIPLQAWGYRLANVEFTCLSEQGGLSVRLKLGLKRIAASPSLSAVPSLTPVFNCSR